MIKSGLNAVKHGKTATKSATSKGKIEKEEDWPLSIKTT